MHYNRISDNVCAITCLRDSNAAKREKKTSESYHCSQYVIPFVSTRSTLYAFVIYDFAILAHLNVKILCHFTTSHITHNDCTVKSKKVNRNSNDLNNYSITSNFLLYYGK